MDELIKSLFTYIQYMVLGALALGLLGYLLATYHPLARLLVNYITKLVEFWQSAGIKNRL
jgi:hypothetical protein